MKDKKKVTKGAEDRPNLYEFNEKKNNNLFPMVQEL
jgi:hypothetical protein